MSPDNAFYGKYRGIVTDNDDPEHLGRIRAQVPDVLSEQKSGWAVPCVPYAGNQVGLFLLPPVGASVWLEFERGNVDYPIWSGCFWSSDDQLPSDADAPKKKVLQTDTATILIDDSAGTSSLKIISGEMKLSFDLQGIELSQGEMSIKITEAGIEINNGVATVTLEGPSVSLNEGALEVI